MAGSTLLVVLFAALTCSTDAEITGWDGGTTAAADPKDAKYTFDVPEGTTTVAATVKVTATLDTTTSCTYTLETPKDGTFGVDQDTGAITVTTALDFETGKIHELKITAVDGSEDSNAVTATATVTINVQDVHSFAKDKDSVCVPDGTTEGETVATLDIADAILSPAYTIKGTNSDKFDVADGKVVVNTGQTITKGEGDPYSLTINQGQDTETLTLTVTVGNCSAASLLAPLGMLTLLMALIVSMN